MSSTFLYLNTSLQTLDNCHLSKKCEKIVRRIHLCLKSVWNSRRGPDITLRQIKTVKQLGDHFVCPSEIAKSIPVYVHRIHLLLCGACDGK